MEQTMTAPSKRTTNAQVGMLVLLASFAMLFGTLLLSYLLIRARQGLWPPIGVEPLDKRLSTLSTLVVVLSSVCLHFSVTSFGKDLWKASRNYWNAGLALGICFIVLQGLFLRDMWLQGHRVEKGLFASINYTIIIVHALHVLVAWVPLTWVALRMSVRKLPATSEIPRLTSWFWHFLGGVWILTYLLLVWY
jgi:heme/copper-type cytochrome/quinol oxidase subunit 3